MRYGLIEVITEHSTWVLGKLGSWTPRLLTLGKWQVDEESWTALVIGWCVLLMLIIIAGCGAPGGFLCLTQACGLSS